MRFPIFRTCIAICTDGSCNSIYKNTDTFVGTSPYELTTFLDNIDEHFMVDIHDNPALLEDDEDCRSVTDYSTEQEGYIGTTRIAQHYNQLEDRFIQKYFPNADIANVTFKE